MRITKFSFQPSKDFGDYYYRGLDYLTFGIVNESERLIKTVGREEFISKFDSSNKDVKAILDILLSDDSPADKAENLSQLYLGSRGIFFYFKEGEGLPLEGFSFYKWALPEPFEVRARSRITKQLTRAIVKAFRDAQWGTYTEKSEGNVLPCPKLSKASLAFLRSPSSCYF